MGLIKAGAGAMNGVLADQWKEFFYCDALEKDILMKKGKKRISGRSSNTRGSENIISNGSGIAVADGQCMIIVEQGKVVEVCAEPGEYTYDKSTEPSIFSGKLGDSIKETFKLIGKRFTYGGDTAKDQRVYYFNTKELVDNKFGTATPIQFKTYDSDMNIVLNIGVRCNGIYSYRIADPILFYTNIAANVSDEYNRSEIEPQLKAEFLSALQPAFARISSRKIDYTQLPAYTVELSDEMNEILSEKWYALRGLKIVSVAINTVSASPEDEEKISRLQEAYTMSNPNVAAGRLAGAQASAMTDAANNSAGAMTGFMGMGFAQQAAGNVSNLFAMGQNQPAEKPSYAKISGSDSWTCACGSVNNGKFCPECGARKPGKAAFYRCDKCGWIPEDPANPPKFCPECGDPFNADDKTER